MEIEKMERACERIQEQIAVASKEKAGLTYVVLSAFRDMKTLTCTS